MIEDVTATNTKLQSNVVKFEKEKEENDSITMSFNQQVKDWKEKYKAKENENRRLKLECDNAVNRSKELCQKLKSSEDLYKFLIPTLGSNVPHRTEVKKKGAQSNQRR